MIAAMDWSTSGDVRRFLAEAGEFLRSRPVENTTLLTEAAYLQARPAKTDQLFGWWRGAGGEVAAAFLRAPGHAPVLSPMPAEAVESLNDVLGETEIVDVDSETAQIIAPAGEAVRSRITLFRLERLIESEAPPGWARTATLSDRELLLHWYQKMMSKSPEDPSDPEYVIDDPIAFGGITLWVADGGPVAMAGRSRLIASMVRLGAVFAVDGNEAHAIAAFAAACRAASEIADHVLVFAPSGSGEAARKYGALGFRPVLERVMLCRKLAQ
jgi:hypothetical protein